MKRTTEHAVEGDGGVRSGVSLRNYPYAQMVYALKLLGDLSLERNDSFSAGDRQLVDRSHALAHLPSLAKRLGAT